MTDCSPNRPGESGSPAVGERDVRAPEPENEPARRALVEAQRLRRVRLEAAGHLAGHVAHELNNLLAPLVAIPELIKMQFPEGHSVRECCDTMLEAAQQLTALGESLMTLSRREQLNAQPQNLNRLVRLAVAQLPTLSTTLVVRLDLAPDLPPVAGSEPRLVRVLVNLLANAREAMADTGRLTIRTSDVGLDGSLGRHAQVEPGRYVRVDVVDSGSGVPPELRDRIFEPFYTTKRDERRRGAGLGLSIVEAIVTDHGGYVDLASEVGKGSTFSVYLPAMVDPTN